MPRILMVTTSHADLGDSGRKTGLWLEELATPYYALLDGGAEVTIASMKGGEVPLDPGSVKADGDNLPSVERFLADKHAVVSVKATPSIDEIDTTPYDAIFLPGGHGTMWDLPGSTTLAKALGQAFDEGRLVAAVCHGPAGLVTARRRDGHPIMDGKRVSAFTDTEEEAVGLTQVVPFLLETRLRELGAHFEKGPDFQPFAVRDGNLITGQNPASADKVAELLLQALE
jgi:putative intracellular protease/amidase